MLERATAKAKGTTTSQAEQEAVEAVRPGICRLLQSASQSCVGSLRCALNLTNVAVTHTRTERSCRKFDFLCKDVCVWPGNGQFAYETQKR